MRLLPSPLAPQPSAAARRRRSRRSRRRPPDRLDPRPEASRTAHVTARPPPSSRGMAGELAIERGSRPTPSDVAAGDARLSPGVVEASTTHARASRDLRRPGHGPEAVQATWSMPRGLESPRSVEPTAWRMTIAANEVRQQLSGEKRERVVEVDVIDIGLRAGRSASRRAARTGKALWHDEVDASGRRRLQLVALRQARMTTTDRTSTHEVERRAPPRQRGRRPSLVRSRAPCSPRARARASPRRRCCRIVKKAKNRERPEEPAVA